MSAAITATRVQLMGVWRIQHQGAPLDVPLGQPRSLLTYLLLQPHRRARRSLLVEELWPETPDERGRRYLTDALYRLRRALPPVPIHADSDSIWLDPDHELWVDLDAFYTATDYTATDAAVTPDVEAPSRETLSGARLDALIQLLENTTPHLAPDITQAWILVHRVRLQERYIQSALAAASAAESDAEAADPARAAHLYQLALEVDPLLEAAHRGKMRCLAHSGRLAAALDHYEQFVDRLEREVEAPPSPATRALADQLYQELDLARRHAQTQSPPRLVGRTGERTALLTALDQARAGRSSLIILLGEPGIGKTTLLEELARAAQWRGWQIHWGRGQDGVAPAPYAPLTAALRQALPPPRAAQLRQNLPAVWLNLLARWLPMLQPEHPLPQAAAEAQRLPQAAAQLLQALQRVAPLLLLLDDAQWADSALWPLLHELIPLLRHQRTLLVLSARRNDLQADAATWQQLETWDREGHAQILSLDGLSPAELDELVAHYRAQQAEPPAAPELAADLHPASGGNPLLALEILQAGTPADLLTSRPAIATLMMQRLQRLPAHARQAAAMAALLGGGFTYEHWQALWQHEHPYGGDLSPQAAALEREGILAIDGPGYRFAHDTLRSAAHAMLDTAARRRCHAAALAYLTRDETRDETGDQALPTSLDADAVLQRLYHAQGAEDAPAVVRYALAAGQHALAAFAFARAEAHFSLALDHIVPSDSSDKTTGDPSAPIQALLGRIHARHHLGDRAGEAADLAAADAHPLSPAQQLALHLHRAEYHLAVGELDQAQASVDACLTGQDGAENSAEIRLLAARIARERSQWENAKAHVLAAQAHHAATGDRWGVAVTTDLLGGLAWDQGDYPTAAAQHAAAADAFAALGDLLREAQSLNNLGSAYWELGRYADARATHERSVLVCRELGSKLSEGDNIDNLGGVAWVLGDYALALRQYRTALALRESINDRWGIAISLSNIASTYRLMGAHDQALDYYARSLPLSRQVGRMRMEAYVVHGQGQTLLDMGRVEPAWERLNQALAMRREVGDRLRQLETHAALIHAALARDDRDAAQEHAAAVTELLAPSDRASLRQEAYYALFVLADSYQEGEAGREQAAAHLAAALAAREEMAAALTPEERLRFEQNVPLNRRLTAAAAAYTVTQNVELAPAQPQSASQSDNVMLTWTLVAPEDYTIADPTERRRHVLARLMAEAEAAHAQPTHAQLAQALGVSRRTILRDQAAQAAASA